MVALGITLGSTTWAVLATVGVAAVLARLGWVYTGIRIAGALYLIWSGAKLLWSAYRAEAPSSSQTPPPSPLLRPRAAFRTGLLTSLTNPKSGAFWTSVFVSVFPPDAPAGLLVATALMVAGLSAGWHCGIALVFAAERVQRGYRRLRRPIDAVC